MLLKMLHCRRKHVENQDGEGPSKDFKLEIKKEASENPDQTCRICLREGKVPIFISATEKLCESIFEIGGIQVCADDPYPKFLCQSCHALLLGAILFRKTAQLSDNLLKTRRAEEPEPTSEIDDHSDADDDTPASVTQPVKSPKPRTCRRCSLEFSTFQEYSDHLLSIEHENKRITCNICKNSYARQYYKRHFCLRKLATTDICDICGKKFTVKSLFSRHRLTHFYDLPYQCAHCPYKGRFSESLKMHMRTHTGEKPYQCEQCPSRFINKSNLNKHMLTHKGEHDFRCEVCGRGFYFKRELDLHFKVDHTGIREHVCQTCGKAFGYRKQMMKHELKVHKREKLKSGRMPIYLKVESMKKQNIVVAGT